MARDERLRVILEGVDKLSKPVGTATKALGSFGKLAGTAVVAGGAAAVAAIGGIGLALGKMALDAAPMQGISDAFEGLTATMEGGSARMLTALQSATLGMVTNRDLMTSFNKAAQLVSIDFAQNLPNAMEPLGKVAAATGQDIGFLMDSLVTGIGRLSPMILDNLGIQVDLTAAYEAYAESLGKSTDELTKTEQQAALMNQVQEKLLENTANMPGVQDTATQSWAAFTTQLENFKDDVGVALLPLFSGIIKHMSYWASEILPEVVKWVEDKLVPALTEMYYWFDDNVIPIIQKAAQWIGDNLPIAMAAVKKFWETKLKPALDKLWTFIQTKVIPIFEELSGKVGDEMPGAIQALTDFWNNTLWPALQRIWEFLTVDMMPIWTALGILLSVTVGKALEALAGLWQNVLQPALEDIWEWLNDKVIPIFRDWFDSLAPIKEIIMDIAGWIVTLAQKIANLSLPDWLTPGSPTPFELGLRGIANAMRDINALQMPGFGYSMQNRVPAMVGAGTRNYNLTVNTSAPHEPIIDDFAFLENWSR